MKKIVLVFLQGISIGLCPPHVKEKGLQLIEKLMNDTQQPKLKQTIGENLEKITEGERDVFL